MSSALRLGDRLAAASPAARANLVVAFILKMLGDELGLAEGELHPRSRFETLGVDSKRALELKELLEGELGCELRTTLLFDYPSPESLAAYIVRVAFGEADNSAPGAPENGAAAPPDVEASEPAEERLRKKLAQYDV